MIKKEIVKKEKEEYDCLCTELSLYIYDCCKIYIATKKVWVYMTHFIRTEKKAVRLIHPDFLPNSYNGFCSYCLYDKDKIPIIGMFYPVIPAPTKSELVGHIKANNLNNKPIDFDNNWYSKEEIAQFIINKQAKG